jgi:hypothetical protein
MPNKKINQLDTRTGAALTDLILIGDPTSGTSFKLTATAFRTLLNNVPYTGATTNVNLGAFNLTATSIIKSGGTSSQFLKADGSVDSTTYQPLLTNPVTGTGVTGQVAYWNGTSSQTGSNNLFWDAANNRLGIGTNAPAYKLHSVGNAFINGSIFFGDASHYIDTNNSTFCMISSNRNLQLARSGTASLTITSNFNTVLQAGGTITDGGQRLQVYGDAFIKGSGATSGTTALTIQNSNASTLFSLKNSGQLTLTGTTSNDTTNILRIEQSGGNGRFLVNAAGQVVIAGDGFQSSESFVSIERNAFNPTSGGASHTSLRVTPTINQTGGANGITRGLYVNPTLTAAADWRSIEWSNNSGWGLYGAGTANNYLAGKLVIGTTTVSTFALDVNGTARVGGSSISAQLYLKGGSGLGQYLYFDDGGSSLWTIIGGSVFVIDSSTTRILRANANAQVTINGSSVNNSAQLQVDSTTKGFLPPRMTNAQRTAIGSPAVGLLVYQTDATEGTYEYISSGWRIINGGGGGGVDELQVALLSQVYG